ncbi:MAG: UDP-N-acetylmuramate--L-alanine ligase, partial [Gammaproteobacteria bacterium]|nr:UDP-N-acetylmuramate--L-alanine ligase [Gammaproteobacteria bacterium]
AIRERGQVEPVLLSDLDEIAPTLYAVAEDNDVVLIMGAGSIGRVAQTIVAQLTALNKDGEGA